MTDPYQRALAILDTIEDCDSISIIQAHQRTDRVITAGQQLADLLKRHAGHDLEIRNALANWHTARNT
jgi:hypothetical protein